MKTSYIEMFFIVAMSALIFFIGRDMINAIQGNQESIEELRKLLVEAGILELIKQ